MLPEPGGAPQEVQYHTSVTPSGIEVAYSAEPRRHYKLRQRHMDCDPEQSWQTEWVETPSVTNVLGVLEKPQLVWWGMKVGVQGCIELAHRGILTLSGPNENPRLEEQIIEKLTSEKLTVNHQRDRAADRGVNVHGALEAWVEGRVIDGNDYAEHERPYVEGLASFILAVHSAVASKEAELMVGSLQHQYAGRFDLVLALSKPVEVVTKVYPKRKPKMEEIPAGRYLLDLKTSKGIYPTHMLQLEAYEAAAVECGYPPTDHRGVIHVTADGRYELALNKDWTLEDFLAVRACYQVMNEREVLRVLRDELDATEIH